MADETRKQALELAQAITLHAASLCVGRVASEELVRMAVDLMKPENILERARRYHSFLTGDYDTRRPAEGHDPRGGLAPRP